MSFSLYNNLNLNRTAYIPVRLKSEGRPSTVAEAKQEKVDSTLAKAVNDRIAGGESWLSWVAEKDQSPGDLNRRVGEVALVGEMNGKTSVDAVLQFEPNARKTEQPILSAELALDGRTWFQFAEVDPKQGGATSVICSASSSNDGYIVHGTVNKEASVKTIPPLK